MRTLNKIFNTLLWGNSVALAWTWGIGLFFSVQIAIQMGFNALLGFATIDAVGLALFGIVNGFLAKRSSPEEYEQVFLDKARNFKFPFLFYQLLAITLTLFCCLKYVSLPLGILSILVIGMFFGSTIFLGEEFNINRIKYSHGVFGVIIFICLVVLLDSVFLKSSSTFVNQLTFQPLYHFKSPISMLALWIPIAVGFLCGPWLDLQNWQRVIEIKKENLSLSASYIIGGLIFWAILMIHGTLAITCFQHAQDFLPEVITKLSSLDNQSLLYSVKSIITRVLSQDLVFEDLLGFYLVFIGLASLTTFDSGYIAYKWYTKSIVKDSKNIIFSFIPSNLFTSPVPGFFLCSVIATVTLHFAEFGKFIAIFDKSLEKFFRFELEHYLGFFASFFVIYSVTFFRNIYDIKHKKSFSGLKLFATALSSIAVFGIGYFEESNLVMATASLLPFIYGWYTVTKEEDYQLKPEILSNIPALKISEEQFKVSDFQSNLIPEGASSVGIKGCYIKDYWFVHHFIPTYQDTNSVGNVYFAMYAMWVGKTRELFFLHAMPNFDPKTSDFLILTRSFEHKFIKEINEFTEVTIQIRISDFNRKFVTLEHKILDLQNNLIGKGQQVLMFVNSKDYSLLDLPPQIQIFFKDFVENKNRLEKVTSQINSAV